MNLVVAAASSAIILSFGTKTWSQETKSLSGRVEEKGGLRRLARPVMAPDPKGNEPAATFELNASIPSLIPASVSILKDAASLGPSQAKGDEERAEPKSFKGSLSESTDSVNTGAAGPTKMSRPDSANHEKNKKQITIRLKKYISLREEEIAWEALWAANKFLDKGADVAVILDMEAVNVANKGDMTEFQPGKGDTSERNVRVQQLLLKVIEKGGKVYLNKRWASHRSMINQGSTTTNGVDFLDDGQMADLLLERSGPVIDY